MNKIWCATREGGHKSPHLSLPQEDTHTDRYLNFDSNHPVRIKRGIIQCLRHRAKKVCNGSTKWQETEHLRQVFRAKGYSEAVIKGNLRGRPTISHSFKTSETPPKLLLLQYIPGLSERIERACQPLGVKTVCRSRSTLRSTLVLVKQPSEDRKKKGVVHEVLCQDCECVYIRKTSRNLEKRLSEHKNATKKHGSNTKWTGRPPRQEKWKRTTGREEYWKPCTSTNSSTPPTLTVVWPSILPGYHCLTSLHALLFSNICIIWSPVLIWFMAS